MINSNVYVSHWQNLLQIRGHCCLILCAGLTTWVCVICMQATVLALDAVVQLSNAAGVCASVTIAIVQVRSIQPLDTSALDDSHGRTA